VLDWKMSSLWSKPKDLSLSWTTDLTTARMLASQAEAIVDR